MLRIGRFTVGFYGDWTWEFRNYRHQIWVEVGPFMFGWRRW